MKLWLVYYDSIDCGVQVDSIWESAEAANHRIAEDTAKLRKWWRDRSEDPVYKPHLPKGTEAHTRFFQLKQTVVSSLRCKEIETATRLDMDA